MPRKKKRNYKRKSNATLINNVLVYFFAAIILFGIIYWISKPSSAFKLPEFGKKVAVAKESLLSKEKQDKTQKIDQDKKSKARQPETELEKGVYSALAKLRISEKEIRRKKTDDAIAFMVPIDPSLSDLTFANMIIKGEVEQKKGVFISGIEKGYHQLLTFRDADTSQKYTVELYYKHKDTSYPEKTKVISIIVDDFGNYNGNLLKGFADSDQAVTFAILPDTPHAVETMELATKTGHESLIHCPMEPINYPEENPGDQAIFIQLSAGEITRRMEKFINKLPDCIGVNNHMGSLATTYEPTMQTVMEVLHKHNLLFVDSRTTNTTIAYKTAQKNLVPSFKRDVFLDEPDLSNANLENKLKTCLNLSMSKAYIIAIMHCHTQAHLAYLNKFIARAKQAGFSLVPISELAEYKLPEIP